MSKHGSRALPATRRHFKNSAEREGYLLRKAEAWLARGNRRRAQHFARQLGELIASERYSRVAVYDQVHRAVCAEAEGDWEEAAKYRKREVQSRRAALALAEKSDAHNRYWLLRG